MKDKPKKTWKYFTVDQLKLTTAKLANCKPPRPDQV